MVKQQSGLQNISIRVELLNFEFCKAGFGTTTKLALRNRPPVCSNRFSCNEITELEFHESNSNVSACLCFIYLKITITKYCWLPTKINTPTVVNSVREIGNRNL